MLVSGAPPLLDAGLPRCGNAGVERSGLQPWGAVVAGLQGTTCQHWMLPAAAGRPALCPAHDAA